MLTVFLGLNYLKGALSRFWLIADSFLVLMKNIDKSSQRQKPLLECKQTFCDVVE